MFMYGAGDFEFAVDQHSAVLWECCLDFVDSYSSDLERRAFKGVPRPVVVVSEDSGGASVIGFEGSDETAHQFVISLE